MINNIMEKKKVRCRFIYMLLITIAMFCVGCSRDKAESQKSKSGSEEVVQGESVEEEIIEEENSDGSPLIISTEYIPIEFQNDTLIVKRSEEMDLYGLLDKNGNTILEPEYDELKYTEMNGETYLRVKNGEQKGVLNMDGTEKIPTEFEEIVSAGNTGWLAVKDEQEYLLDIDGEVKKKFNKSYCQIVGDEYLVYPNFKSGLYDSTESLMGLGDVALYSLNETKVIDNIRLSCYINNDVFLEIAYEDKKNGDTEVFMQLVNVRSGKRTVLPNSQASIEAKYVEEENKVYYAGGQGHPWRIYYVYDINENKSSVYMKTENREKFSPELNIKAVQTGKLYYFEDINGQKITEEKYADYYFDDNCIQIENIDNEWGVMDIKGNMIIPFGDIDKGGDNGIYLGEKIETFIDNKDNFCFYIEKEGVYEFYAFPLNKK